MGYSEKGYIANVIHPDALLHHPRIKGAIPIRHSVRPEAIVAVLRRHEDYFP